MQTDRYTKVVLSIIAAALVWIAFAGVPTPAVQAQPNAAARYEITPGGSAVFRIDKQTGKVVMFVDQGEDPRSGKPWEKRVVSGTQ